MVLTDNERKCLGLIEQLVRSYEWMEREEPTLDIMEMFDVTHHLKAIRRTLIHRAAIRTFGHLNLENHNDPESHDQQYPAGAQPQTVYGERTL